MPKDLQIIKELQSRFGEFGYELNNDKEVVVLGIWFNNVKNEDLGLIGELTSLQKLLLSDNKISKIEGLDKLTKLRELYLSDNEITKIEGLDSLTKLKKLDLEFNQITKIEGLDTLVGLQSLNLSYNQITEIGGIKKLTKLRKLDLGYNQIETIQDLDKLVNSKELWVELGFNKILESEKRGFKTIRTENSRIDITYNM